MRLWSYQLLPVLPDKMIVAEWRELVAIKRQWEKGTLKHRLVSYVMDYDKVYFMNYVLDVMAEMSERGIKYQDKYHTEICDFCEDDLKLKGLDVSKYYPEHNDRYLKQCYYNLQEKYDRRNYYRRRMGQNKRYYLGGG